MKMLNEKGLPTSETFCALPWVHLSTRPNGHMRVCCTANASGVQNPDSQDKVDSDIGIIKKKMLDIDLRGCGRPISGLRNLA